MSVTVDLPRRLVAEALGTGLLVTAVVGSGVMAEQLAGGNVAVALLANTIATGGALVALIHTFGPVSGAHFNPAVTAADAVLGALPATDAAAYAGVQVAGAIVGAVVADAMFDLPLVSWSQHARTGPGQWLGELVATFGLLGVIASCTRRTPSVTPWAVAAWIVGAYWFTSSTSFANPAVTVARAFTDTFAGIRPVDVPGFVVAQLTGAMAAVAVFRWLVPPLRAVEPAVEDRPPMKVE
ncbi:MAG: MIP/aquaporin family protein [Myxococcota bacterium]